jgi:hypothetical protein
VLLVANGEFLLAGLFPQLTLARLPAGLYHGLLFAFDIVSLLALAGVILAAARRLFFAPDYLGNERVSARSGEAFLILALIAALMVAYFLLHGAEILLGEKGAAAGAMPVSRTFGALLTGLSPRRPAPGCRGLWWCMRWCCSSS